MDLTEVGYFLKFTDAVIGTDGPITLDANILGWAAEWREYAKEKDLFVIGQKGKKITFEAVSKIFNNLIKNPMFIEAFHSRDFVFEGVEHTKSKMWKIRWGS